VLFDQCIERRHRDAQGPTPAHAGEARRRGDAPRPVGRQRGDGGRARADQQRRLALAFADRLRQQRHVAIAREEPVQHALAVGLRLDGDDARPEAPPGAHAVAHVRTDVEGETAARHQCGVELNEALVATGDAVVDPHRPGEADQAMQVMQAIRTRGQGLVAAVAEGRAVWSGRAKRGRARAYPRPN